MVVLLIVCFAHRAFAVLTSSLMFFVQHPCWAIYFFPTAKRSNHKFIGNEFEHPQDGPKADAARVKYRDIFHKRAALRPSSVSCATCLIEVAMICSLQALLKWRPCHLPSISLRCSANLESRVSQKHGYATTINLRRT
jgi:hypothetical protein